MRERENETERNLNERILKDFIFKKYSNHADLSLN
jgi:hypothetical protein